MTATPHSLEGAVQLQEWGVIRARGSEAAKFLHAQLTQDVEHLDLHHARLAGYCSAKGRLLASFVVLKAQNDDVLLACSADLLQATLKRLSMFVLRAKCKLSDASTELSVWGLAGAAAATWLCESLPAQIWQKTERDLASIVRLPDAAGQTRCLLIQPASIPAPPLSTLSTESWRWLEVRSGVPRVVSATADQFVPQMLNFEVLGGVDFRKGCYPGQEVVARSQYRGTIKRRTMLFETTGSPQSGDEIFHSDDPAQPAGMVANGALCPSGGIALIEVKLAALESGSLHLHAIDGPTLTQSTLPYEIPAETA